MECTWVVVVTVETMIYFRWMAKGISTIAQAAIYYIYYFTLSVPDQYI